PAGASTTNQVPGVVLVHGGGGTAYSQWVQLWTDRGYAAISIAVEGQTDIAATQEQKDAGLAVGNWLKHAMPGPARVGVYGDSDVTPISDQWMYHAVADTVLANSLIRSLPEVVSDEVGLMGISWGGVIASTAIGIDSRFSFGVPVYGCGSMADAGNWWGDALGNNELYKNVWDPMVRIGNVTQPMLWLSWPEDAHFPLDSQADCYRAAPGPHMVSLIPGMGHGHGAAWNRPESYAFADSIINDGTPWCQQQSANLSNGLATVEFSATKVLDHATIIVTLDSGFTGSRTWTETPANLISNGSGSYTVTAPIPDYATAWFINVHSGSLVASSDYQEAPETFTLSYSAGANGSISGSNPQAVRYGEDGSAITAVPDTGYHFVNWSDGSTVNPRIDANVIADINVTANFAIDTFTLSYTAGPNGSITGASPQVIEYGSNGSEVTAVPDAGYLFTNWSDGSTANPRIDTNATSDINVTANFEIDPPLGDVAISETTLLGTVSAGTINDTHESDDVYQVLTEEESGGRRNRRRSQLEHKWVFDVTGGELVTFFVEAHHSANSEGDDFLFSYSIDDLNYTNMLTVSKTEDDDTVDFYILPGDLSGMVYVRVIDTDRTQGNNVLDQLYIDNLLIVSESASEPPSAAAEPNPADGASGVPMNNAALSWTPGLLAASHNVYFGLNPTPGAEEFQGNQTTSIYSPGELAANTTYYWAIDAVNSAGTTQGPVWSFTTSGITPEMHVSAIDLAVQRKGKNYSGVVTVKIVDSATGLPISGANVQGDFSGIFSETAGALTDASGEATLSTSAKERLPFSYTFTVTGVSMSGYIYQPASNNETADSGSF
ncbi:MAG: InlB B-repeat-containing protein, partial [Akkermansiaceae bacterium]